MRRMNEEMKAHAIKVLNEIDYYFELDESLPSYIRTLFQRRNCLRTRELLKTLNSAPANLRYADGEMNASANKEVIDPMGNIMGNNYEYNGMTRKEQHAFLLGEKFAQTEVYPIDNQHYVKSSNGMFWREETNSKKQIVRRYYVRCPENSSRCVPPRDVWNLLATNHTNNNKFKL